VGWFSGFRIVLLAAPSHPPKADSGHAAAFVPGYSSASATEFHRASLCPRAGFICTSDSIKETKRLVKISAGFWSGNWPFRYESGCVYSLFELTLVAFLD
jgi:hypothetical protein